MAKGGGRARTYVRDGRGRFASTPGGGASKRPATRKVSRERNRLTRDNGGRITSVGGNGATARGGRLRTAAGSLRARQVDRLKVAPLKGAISRGGKRRVGQGPGKTATPPSATPQAGGRFTGLGLRPGVIMSAIARPVGVIGIPRKRQESPFQAGNIDTRYRISKTNDDKKARLANAATAKAFFESKGFRVRYGSNRTSGAIASFNPATREITINRSHSSWANPARSIIESRRLSEFSSAAPLHALMHELGHSKDKNILGRRVLLGNPWIPGTRQGSSQARMYEIQTLARRVSRYATKSPSEFVAETYAGLRAGHRYDREVMQAYRETMGLPARPAARHRSRLRRPKAKS